jgi:putative DNA primase/helicase
MSNAVNFDDAVNQMVSFGLLLRPGEVVVGSRGRCYVSDDHKEKRGWYFLREYLFADRKTGATSLYVVGSFGIFRSDESNKQRIDLKFDGLDVEQKKVMRDQYARDLKEAARAEAEKNARAAQRATAAWARLAPTGDCDYLKRKGITIPGARYTPSGNLAIPFNDAAGAIHGLQIIYGNKKDRERKGRDKDFWPAGNTYKGHYFLLGSPAGARIILIAEGAATGASLHACTGHCVAIAFTAGNLPHAAKAILKRYRSARILVCADDDFCTAGNPGITKAQEAAAAVGGAIVVPVFDGDPLRPDIAAANIDFTKKDYKQHVERVRAGRPKWTDFNDLQQCPLGGTHSVTAQIEAKIVELKWRVDAPPRVASEAGGRGKSIQAITSVDEIFERYAIIYGHSEALFDARERMLVALKDMKLACAGRELWRTWLESSDKKIVRMENVGFDPSGKDDRITCNLWGGWPIKPEAGECSRLLDLLEYLCSGEDKPKDMHDWILNWLAYPLQHPGAKMKTALIIHGPQRVGKNLFFESIMGIYGEYGQVINQAALEDKYNDCLSRKLFLIADEVVARQELYHVKNQIKGLITSDSIRINPKNIKSYWEKNHCNLVFLSNEVQPLVLERDDGRFVVLWTPEKLSREFYGDVNREIENGGIASLYHYLLRRDLGSFCEHTQPPMSRAKTELMDLGMDSEEQFWRDWTTGRIDGVPVVPVKTSALYKFYRDYCSRVGHTYHVTQVRFFAHILKRTGAKRGLRRFDPDIDTKQAEFIFPVGVDQPPGKNIAAWLSECIEDFSSGVSKWREEFNDGR